MKNFGLICWGFALLGCGDGDATGEKSKFDDVSETVKAGGTLTTDVEGDGVSKEDPVETSVTSPNGGTVSVNESTISQKAPAGTKFFGQQINITAPKATAEDPLILVFTLHSSIVPDQEDEDSIQLFRSAKLVAPSCTGKSGEAEPDPCISKRRSVDGNVELTALTSEASPWNFGTVEEEPAATKGELDISSLQEDAWPVLIDGDIATVKVPFSTPLPASVETLDEPGEELADALSFVVESNETGATANFATGTYVSGEPTKPGQFTISLNDDRDEATLVFWNESRSGLTLKTDRLYTVSIAITGSAYIEDLDPSVFEVAPEQE